MRTMREKITHRRFLIPIYPYQTVSGAPQEEGNRTRYPNLHILYAMQGEGIIFGIKKICKIIKMEKHIKATQKARDSPSKRTRTYPTVHVLKYVK